MTTGTRQLVRPLLTSVLLLGALGGCGDADTSSATVGQPATGAPAGSSAGAAVVVVEDAGASPRSELRLDLEVGDRSRGTLAMEMEMSMSLDGEHAPSTKAPRMELDMDIEVTEITAGGNVTGSFEYVDVRVIGSQDGAEESREALRPLIGVRGWLTTTSTGQYVDGQLEVPEDLAEPMASTMRSMEQQLASLVAPLPSEPVGVGAAWTTTSSLDLMGVAMKNEGRYRLVARRGDVLELEVSYEQTAAEGQMVLPGMPDGATARLLSMRGSGRGRTQVSLGGLFPQSSSVTGHNLTKMRIDADGESADMTQEMTLTMEMTSH